MRGGWIEMVSQEEGLTLTENREGTDNGEIREKTGAPFRVSEDLRAM